MTNVTISKDKTLIVDETKLPQIAKDYIWAYGLKQVFNDAGSSGKDKAEKLEMAQAKLEALYAGTIRTAREGKPSASQAETLAARFAMADLKKALIAGGKKIKQFEDAQLDALVLKLLEKNAAHYEKLAGNEIVRLANVAKDAQAVDLSALGL